MKIQQSGCTYRPSPSFEVSRNKAGVLESVPFKKILSYWGQLGFQDGCSLSIYLLIIFHNFALMLLIGVIRLVVLWFYVLFSTNLTRHLFFDFQGLEIFWTVVPGLVIYLLAVPSLYVLYYLEESVESFFSYKVVGNQWYWSYSLPEFGVFFDSYIKRWGRGGDYRCLDVDYSLLIPLITSVRILVTRRDVIHCWAVPSLGVKVDGVPGRINQLDIKLSLGGIFFGQCSEICGVNHRMMPICIEGVRVDDIFML